MTYVTRYAAAQEDVRRGFAVCHDKKHVLTDKKLSERNRTVRALLAAAHKAVAAAKATLAESQVCAAHTAAVMHCRDRDRLPANNMPR